MSPLSLVGVRVSTVEEDVGLLQQLGVRSVSPVISTKIFSLIENNHI